eukprot:TRINITY_DN27_c0_g1_i1.p1 TRINITY_DN27_c0_g1~~TRINITY_DN27_c0_g1_i1.p1  ORF type:complete len:250 (+),score=21.87 TRINITY_DN27_c0_g1_i1:125-874(+)
MASADLLFEDSLADLELNGHEKAPSPRLDEAASLPSSCATTPQPSPRQLGPVTVWFVRHGQAEHNVAKDLNIRDPHLTELGRQQASAISEYFRTRTLDAIVVSPLRRTIETALIAFKRERAAGVPIILSADAQETQACPADTGSPPASLQAEYPELDFSQLSTNWYVKEGINAPTKDGWLARFGRLRQWLETHARENGWSTIALVGHCGVFRRLLNGEEFGNGESKRYSLHGGELLALPATPVLDSMLL